MKSVEQTIRHLITKEAEKAHPSPSEAQKSSGVYRKGHLKVHGLDIVIENPRGSKREGISKNGKPWSVVMPNHYGAFRGTEAKDGDGVDCYIGRHIMSPHVYVIDQVDADTGKYDEAKCCLGFANEKQALRGYEAGFSDGHGKDRIGKITAMTIPQFKDWLNRGDTKAPFKHPHVKLESEKATHAAVNYVRLSKKEGENCARCKHFLPPSACQGVKKPISPRGWCQRFERAHDRKL